MIARVVAILLACVACWTSTAVCARAAGPEIAGIRVGFADRYKVGLYAPVLLAIRGGDEAFEGQVAVTVPDGDGVPTRFTTDPAKPCRVEAGTQAEVRLYVRFGRVKSTLRAELSASGKPVISRVFSTADKADADHFLPAIQGQPLMLVLGDAPQGIEEAVDLEGAAADRRAVVVSLKDARCLPDRWYGYEGVDSLIISTSSSVVFPADAAVDSTLTSNLMDNAVTAVRGWVEQGGGVLLCGGANSGELLAEGRPLAKLLPGKFVKEFSLKQTGALEGYCRSNVPVPRQGGVPLKVAQLDSVDGRIEVQEGNLPLVVCGALGAGRVVFFAGALDQTPFARWKDRPLLVARLLTLPVTPADDSREASSVMHFGYDDLAGQLRSALDRFEGVGAAPFSLVAGLMVLYIALVGPLDYLLLYRCGRRMGLTWITFPLTVAGFCILAFVLTHSLRGNVVRIHQVDLIDADLAARQVHGTTWFNLYTPQAAGFDLAVRPRLPDGAAAADAQSVVGWMGLPGDALGGMNPKGAEAAPWSTGYEFAPQLNAITAAPIAAGATKSFTARWTASGKAPVDAELSLQDDLPTGALVNGLDVPLTHCLLAYRDWVFELGDIAPGEAATIGAMSRRSELRTLLTGRKMVLGDGKWSTTQMATPYDGESADPTYILRMMSFFEAAGGRRYTGLANDYQRFVDRTPLLSTGRAVLFAVGPSGAQAASRRVEVLCNGAPIAAGDAESAILYRVIIPIRPAKHP